MIKTIAVVGDVDNDLDLLPPFPRGWLGGYVPLLPFFSQFFLINLCLMISIRFLQLVSEPNANVFLIVFC